MLRDAGAAKVEHFREGPFRLQCSSPEDSNEASLIRFYRSARVRIGDLPESPSILVKLALHQRAEPLFGKVGSCSSWRVRFRG